MNELDYSKPIEETLSQFIYNYCKVNNINLSRVDGKHMLDEMYYDFVCEFEAYINKVKEHVAEEVAEQI